MRLACVGSRLRGIGTMFRRILVITVLAAPAAALCAVPAIQKDQITTSDTCGSCHVDIFRMWKKSVHAQSMEDPIFVQAYRETEAREGASVARICLGCHAPMTLVNGDWALREKVTWEGVTCDVCHSLVSVELKGGNAKQTFAVGRVKRGPIKDAESTAHEVAYSELHTTSLACAGCHEYANPEGTPILTTFSEWTASPAAKKGTTCQGCHMATTRANVVDPRVKRVAGAVNLHEMPGGHSLDQLHQSMGVSIRPRFLADALEVELRLNNKGAGHSVPTGMPGRKVILTVAVRSSDGKAFEEKRIYAKTFNDAHGNLIARDSGFFAPGVRVKSDTRFEAGEVRVESFHFPVDVAKTAYLTVKLQYEHAPTGGAENRTQFTFFSEERTLTPEVKKK